MRNISFDESLVLREFARIAQEQGLIKTAEAPVVPPVVPPGSPLTKPVALPPVAQQAKEQADKAKRDKELVDKFTNMVKTQPADDMADVEAPQERWLSGLNASESISDVAKNDLIKVFTGLGSMSQTPSFGPSIETIKIKEPKLYETLLPKIQLAETRKLSSRIEKLVVKAEGVYDVSGETGEQLVDSAHPGKMHTEVSQRKDDEGNLVETIVEQQEADKEVAWAAPKGTYASLMNLREKLNKLGHADVLAELDGAIKLAATPEEVFQYHLLSLANKLDAAGFIDIASKVDAIVKKAIDWSFSGGRMMGETEEEYNARTNPMQPTTPAGEMFPGGGTHDPDAMMSYQQETQTPVTQAPAAAAAPAATKPTADQTAQAAQVAQKFQAEYNKLMTLTNQPQKRLNPDGKWGPKTNAAWKEIGNWSELHKRVQEAEKASWQTAQQQKMVQPAPTEYHSPVPPPPTPETQPETIPGFIGAPPTGAKR